MRATGIHGPGSGPFVGLLLSGACAVALTGCAGSGATGTLPLELPLPTGPAVVRSAWTSCAEEAFQPVDPPDAGRDGEGNSGSEPGGGTNPNPGTAPDVGTAGDSGTGSDGGARGEVPPFPFGDDPLTMPRLPEDFVATAAVLCVRTPQTRPDGGQDMVEAEKRAENVDDLVAALRLPDEARTYDECPLVMIQVPWFVVLDADGRWTRPGVPRNVCSQPRHEVMRALDGLDLTQVSARPVAEIESAGAAASGCGQGRADTVAMETRLAPGRASRPLAGVPLASARQVRLCVYRVPADQQGTEKPAGDFEYGLLLPADRWTRLRAALADRGPARDCTLPASRFGLLQDAGDAGGGEVTVELDGCRRILVTTGVGDPTLAQGDAALADLLGP